MAVQTLCSHRGCIKPQPCKEHTRTSAVRAKPYNNARWRNYRLRFLAARPLCELYCKTEGRITAANTVDHIRAHKGDMELFWNPANHAAACAACNRRKANEFEGGWGH